MPEQFKFNLYLFYLCLITNCQMFLLLLLCLILVASSENNFHSIGALSDDNSATVNMVKKFCLFSQKKR